jgi:hypothetical protein
MCNGFWHESTSCSVCCPLLSAGAGDGDEDVKESPIVAQLHHVMTDDKGKPAIDPSTHVQKVPGPS